MNQPLDHKLQETITAYIRDSLSSDERIAFELRLGEDPSLMEEVLLQKSLLHAFNENDWDDTDYMGKEEDVNAIRTQLRSDDIQQISKHIRKTEDAYFNEGQEERPTNGKRLYTIIAIAAVLIVLVGIPFFLSSGGSNYENYANWNDLPSLVEMGTQENTIVKAEILYKSTDYNGVIETLDTEIKEGDVYYTYGLIYQGASYFQLNNFEKAHQTFDELIQTNTLQSSYGYWYKMLIYLKNENIPEVKRMLDTILSNSENYNYAKAKTLQAELK